MKFKNNVRFMAQSAAIAGTYIALTFLSSLFGLSSGAIQVRLSEALCILPMFTPSAIPGLAIGCLLANLLTGCALPDIIFGSLATLIGAVFTRIFKEHRLLAVSSPILSNALIIPFVLKFAYGLGSSVFYFMTTIFIGEVISCGVLGCLLIKAIKQRNDLF